jgi:hypothetical protein
VARRRQDAGMTRDRLIPLAMWVALAIILGVVFYDLFIHTDLGGPILDPIPSAP